MQSVVTIDNDIYTNKKRPSTRLQEKIRNCVSVFRSLNETVNAVIEIGKSEGLTPKEIGQFIRQEMIKSGVSRSTVTRYLPAELKMKPRGKQISRNLSQNQAPPYSSILASLNYKIEHVVLSAFLKASYSSLSQSSHAYLQVS
jgi:hypothetical protein